MIDLASISAGLFQLTYAQETRHIVVRKPTKCVSGGESRDHILLQSNTLTDADDTIIATTDRVSR